MKKQKRSNEWQEQDLDSAENMRFDLELEDSEEEEEIIELEDILEVAEDSPDFGVQAFDSDSDLDLKELELEFDSANESLMEDDDLSGDFSFEEEKIAEGFLKQDAEAVSSSASKEEIDIPFEPEEKIEPLPDREEVSMMVDSTAEVEPTADSQVEEVDTRPSLEEYVGQIEDRLLQAVQQIVESKLPEVVRTILREEIDRLMQESEKEKV
jgi:hypothetical protein